LHFYRIVYFSKLLQSAGLLVCEAKDKTKLTKKNNFILPHQVRPNENYFASNSDAARKNRGKRQQERVRVG